MGVAEVEVEVQVEVTHVEVEVEVELEKTQLAVGNPAAQQEVPAYREVPPAPRPAFQGESGGSGRLAIPGRPGTDQCFHPWFSFVQRSGPAGCTHTGLPPTGN